jgi:hypothetical protein
MNVVYSQGEIIRWKERTDSDKMRRKLAKEKVNLITST